MSKIEKIRAEIERRYAYQKEMYSKTKPDGRPNDGWAESLAIMGELEELRDFLDTLEEEPDKSLEEAAGKYLDNHKPLTRYNWGDLMDAFIAGAKWQKEQMPAEWSEEDEQLIGFIFDLLNGLVWRKDWAMSKEECLERLKSLRPSWKPSEWQMSMLLAVINDPNNAGAESCQLALKSLYEQLKKLM